MKKSRLLFALIAVAVGCGPSQDEVRSIAQDELSRLSTVRHITDASVIGPYSPAIQVGNFLFVSGQLGLNPETMELEGIDIESQTRRALENILAILTEAGYDSSEVIQCMVFLKEIDDYQRMNLIYGGYFEQNRYPTRVTVEVSDLPRNALVEISAIACKGVTP
jgi:reactive intermediate/imine deaminase